MASVCRLAPCLWVSAGLFLIPSLVFAQAPAAGASIAPAGLSANAMNEIGALLQEKASRTPAQQKMDSQLVHALKHNRGEAFAPGAPHVQMDVKMETDGRVLVDITATVTPKLLSLIQSGGGQVINSFPEYRAIRALVTLPQLETLAGSTNVNYVRRASQAYTNKADSEGDTTHRAIDARNTFGINGSGIKVGVLSDSVDYYTNLQTAGDLPTINILTGQSGLGQKLTGEGTAMLEIVNDLAPGATLYFATANGGDAQFAYNILNLWTNGCKIIADDADYNDEPPFQDGIVAQAVNTVTANGVLYFSAAINSGNLDDGTSGTWEGDFADGGAAASPIPETGRLHSFGSATYDTCTGGSQKRVDLFWSDPLGASSNDYDLFELDPTGTTVVGSSTSVQNGTQNPYESIGTLTNGNRIVIVKYNGAGRFLHLSTGRAQLSIATSGSTRGHPAAATAFGVAAIDIHSAYPNPFTGGTNNPFETFSSDGLRQMFYNADGSAITPGNFSSTGGAIRQKPDIAAADDVSTDVPGFQPFSGTSAAAPHAAAIAALLWSYAPGLTAGQMRTILTSTALDENPAGVDRDTGYGIVMAYQALNVVAQSPPANVWVDFNYAGTPNNGAFVSPFNTLAQGVSAVSSGGTIWIRTAGSSVETMTVSKPLTIHAYNGAASIGH
jgi:Subtilase family